MSDVNMGPLKVSHVVDVRTGHSLFAQYNRFPESSVCIDSLGQIGDCSFTKFEIVKMVLCEEDVGEHIGVCSHGYQVDNTCRSSTGCRIVCGVGVASLLLS